jgi:hypothetical protein
VSAQKVALEDEIKQLRARLEDTDAALTQAELTRRAAEGDLQRSRMAIKERDSKICVSCATICYYPKGVYHLCKSQLDYSSRHWYIHLGIF